MTYFEALLIAIVEGITEFLPISSTGHMMLTTALLGVVPTDFVKLYTVAIQLGAILSVVVLYFKHFFKSVGFYFKLVVAFIPSAIAGLLLGDWIDAQLENIYGVAVALFAGGIVLVFVDKWFKNPSVETGDDVSYLTALKIGAFQCLALFPGVSRSASTIIGGMSQKLTRQAAAEFSFFLAVPTMAAATLKKLLDFYKDDVAISGDEIKILLFGNAVAFVVALIAIKTFINLLNKFGFKWFGIYRILVGGTLLLLFWLKVIS
ncbi:MAG: undecaprenyl-diphosphate phosphatase [Bacteroidota bacterium]|jgi:undecaprenyl-diphosphatase|nr:undecaprenyl-diphosphate phosphatase [Bacteroidota bacterium]MCA6442640.1 undecaprenyl-diphosphate phosphatase [Bacteroidota bacterium]